jgi:hypothetical protein
VARHGPPFLAGKFFRCENDRRSHSVPFVRAFGLEPARDCTPLSGSLFVRTSAAPSSTRNAL